MSATRTAVALLALWTASGCSGSDGRSADSAPAVARGATPAEPALREELLRLYRDDQAIRDGFSAAMAANDTIYQKRLAAGDSARTVRLQQIVSAHGWPTPALVGTDGVNAAWHLLQHSPVLTFQQEMLPRLEGAAARGEIPARDVALLTDRVLVRQGKPQRYGSSFTLEGGRLVAHPIEDLGGVEARRATVGLQPMSEYVQALQTAYQLPVVWPPQH